MKKNIIFKGNTSKLIGSLILYITIIFILSLILIFTFDDFKMENYELYTNLTIIVGCIIGAFFVFRAFKDFLIHIEFLENSFIINKETYYYKDITPVIIMRRFRYNGIPIRNKLRLHLYDKNNEKIKSYRFEGFTADTANKVFSLIENNSAPITQSAFSEEKTQDIFNTSSSSSKINFQEKKTFITNLKPKKNIGFAIFFWIFTILIIFIVIRSLNDDLNTDLAGIIILGILFAVCALIFTFKKPKNRYPQNITFDTDNIIFDNKSFIKNEIKQIYFTPVDVINHQRVLKITYKNQTYTFRLGFYWETKKTVSVIFDDYDKFITYLKAYFSDTPEKVIEDVTLIKY